MAFFVLGLITLVYVFLRFKEIKTYALLVSLVGIALVFSTNTLFMFYLFSSIFLAYICFHYLRLWWLTQNINSLLMVIAFVLLLTSHVPWIASVGHGTYTEVSHVLEVAAYILILLNLVWVVKRHGNKKNKNTNYL